MKQNYINGAWIDGASATENINPWNTADVIGHYAQADPRQTDLAIAAAAAAAPAWGLSNPQMRANALDKIDTEIRGRKEELGALLSREEGKTLPEGIGEAGRAGAIFKFFAQECLRLRGDKLASVRPGLEVEVTREPVGVVGIIAPWNFPIAIPAWKIAPALANGNCVLMKPAELVPGTSWALAEIIGRAGLPAGAFNLAMGRGSFVGQAFLNDGRVNAISFTGSAATGAKVAQAAMGRLARVQIEIGGKNPLVVLNDADMSNAVNCAVQGAFYSTGQRCTASSRLIVEKGIYRAFAAALKTRLAALKVGDALMAETDIGPVVSADQFEQGLDYIRIGQGDGATLAFGGGRVQRDTDGFYLAPALITDCSNDMRISREEIFGPVASLIPADNYEPALALDNDTEFGLSSGICTTSLKYATHFKRHAQAGMVMVNVPIAGVDCHVPLGGTKGSSYGSREQGTYAAEFFNQVKTAYCGV